MVGTFTDAAVINKIETKGENVVSQVQTTMDSQYCKLILAPTAVQTTTSNGAATYSTDDLTVSLPTGASVQQIILCIGAANWPEGTTLTNSQLCFEYRKDSDGWTTVTNIARCGYGDANSNYKDTASQCFKIDVTSALSGYSSTLGCGIGTNSGNGANTRVCGSSWFEIYYTV